MTGSRDVADALEVLRGLEATRSRFSTRTLIAQIERDLAQGRPVSTVVLRGAQVPRAIAAYRTLVERLHDQFRDQQNGWRELASLGESTFYFGMMAVSAAQVFDHFASATSHSSATATIHWPFGAVFALSALALKETRYHWPLRRWTDSLDTLGSGQFFDRTERLYSRGTVAQAILRGDLKDDDRSREFKRVQGVFLGEIVRHWPQIPFAIRRADPIWEITASNVAVRDADGELLWIVVARGQDLGEFFSFGRQGR